MPSFCAFGVLGALLVVFVAALPVGLLVFALLITERFLVVVFVFSAIVKNAYIYLLISIALLYD